MEPPKPRQPLTATTSFNQIPQASGSQYAKPTWSAIPKEDTYNLEVIKNGVVIENIPLRGKEFFRIGRQPDIVDIAMEHGSISRLHAVLNFHEDGSAFIFDNNSANGTFVNKNRISPQEYHKIKVGDILKFGESTRINIFNGPSTAYDDDEESKQMEKIKEIVKTKMEKQKEILDHEQDNSISWGFRDDAEEVNSDDEANNSSDNNIRFQNGKIVQNKNPNDNSDEDERFRAGDGGIHAHRLNLPQYLLQDENYNRKHGEKFELNVDETLIKSEKDREILDKLRKKERKIQSLQEETRRIYMKEHQQEDGLTTGQQAVVSRNDKVISDLLTDVEDLMKKLQQKHMDRTLNSSAIDSSARKRSREDEPDDDDNAIYDTSNSTADANTNWRLKKKLSKLKSISK